MPEKLYNFSFDKKSATLLAVCSLVLAALLVSAGYLLGRSSLTTPEGAPDTSGETVLVPPATGPPATAASSAAPPAALPPASSASPSAAPPSTAPEDVPAKASPASPAPESPAAADPPPASPAASAVLAPGAADPSKPAAEKPAGRYALQFDSFQDRAAALAKLKQLKAESVAATLFTAQDQAGQTWFAVRTGAYPDLVSASKAADALAAQTGEFIIVRPSRRL